MSTRIINDGFETGFNTGLWTVNTVANSGYPVAIQSGATHHADVAPAAHVTGTGLLKFNWGLTYYNQWIGATVTSYALDAMYISYWIYYQTPFVWNNAVAYRNSNNKHFRFFGPGQSGGAGSGQDYDYCHDTLPAYGPEFRGGIQRFGDNATLSSWYGQDYGGSMPEMSYNTWHHWECFHQLNTTGQSNGIQRVWVDGVVLLNKTNSSLQSGGAKFESFYFPGNNSGVGGDNPFYDDDVEIWDGMPSGGSPPVGTPVLSVR
jgi:hypothetical protein